MRNFSGSVSTATARQSRGKARADERPVARERHVDDRPDVELHAAADENLRGPRQRRRHHPHVRDRDRHPCKDPAMAFADDFDGPALDPGVWVPHYLPHVELARRDRRDLRASPDSELRLTIPPEQGLWCAERPRSAAAGLRHPVGRVLRRGRQHGRPAAVPRRRARARAPADPVGLDAAPRSARDPRAHGRSAARSMAAVWMVGLEDEPDAVRARSASSRCSATRSATRTAGRRRPSGWASTRSATRRSPRSSRAARVPIDVAEFHVYAADWRPGRVDFLVDGEHVKTVRPGPGLPDADDGRGVRLPGQGRVRRDHVPLLAVDFVRGTRS